MTLIMAMEMESKFVAEFFPTTFTFRSVDWLGICVFGCGTHAVLAYARAACSKPHSQVQAPACSWVLSYLPSYSLYTFHTTVSTSAYPLARPSALASWTIAPQGTLVGTYSSYRPPMRAFLWLLRSNLLFYSYRRWVLSTGRFLRMGAGSSSISPPCVTNCMT